MSDDTKFTREPGDIELPVPAELLPKVLAAQKAVQQTLTALFLARSAAESAPTIEERRIAIAPARAVLNLWEQIYALYLQVMTELLNVQEQTHGVDLSKHSETLGKSL